MRRTTQGVGIVEGWRLGSLGLKVSSRVVQSGRKLCDSPALGLVLKCCLHFSAFEIPRQESL